MNVKRQPRTGIRLALSVSVLVVGCSSNQSAAAEEVAEVEARSPLSSSDDVATKAEIFNEELFAGSAQEADAETAQSGDDQAPESRDVTAESAVEQPILSADTQPSTTTEPVSTTALVADIDLVACANVETGYLFLLNGHSANAEPFLLLGSSQASTSNNPDYSAASEKLSSAVGAERTNAADAFLTLCEADGFERLA